ncbi:DUF6777 domain-containing protein [Gandjariella thermophila]|uniref:DUF6777 domain-containing protein n=1 Tax=Gandjariella thermophila TaxID=1931992 RepID=A0A4D4JGU6_9PSEU|nr:DUF6777 domain-containing protein [Gandjariella thermophila]GDY33123.1 hypothetical protein GTS_47560 [Gandjariella thermophila]
MLAGLVIALAAAACASQPPAPPAASYQLEPAATSGVPPFTPPVGTDQPVLTRPPQARGRLTGNTPGLYGGSRNNARCDPHALVAFLRANPEKAAAWAGVLGISPAQIPGYVDGLTPVLLRTDTAVTNHGFDNGRVTTEAAVVQAGTAVLVDGRGVPVTKCNCGNPLTPPPTSGQGSYRGAAWPGFSAQSVTVIQQSTTVVNDFVLVEPGAAAAFIRPIGTVGAEDAPTTMPPSPGTPAPSGPAASRGRASWQITDCLVDRANNEFALRARIFVRNEDSNVTHNYRFRLLFGTTGDRYAEPTETVYGVPPGQNRAQNVSLGPSYVSESAKALPAGPVRCEITQVLDENNAEPMPGSLPAQPPASSPTGSPGPATTSPGPTVQTPTTAETPTPATTSTQSSGGTPAR